MRMILGLGISAACLLALVLVLDWPSIWQAFQLVTPAPLALAAMLVAGNNLTLALRWRLALPGSAPPLGKLVLLQVSSLAANLVLPFRSGDVLRATLLKRVGGGSFVAGMGSLLIERLLDMLTLAALGLLVALIIPLPEQMYAGLTILVAVLSAGGVIILGLALAVWRRMGRESVLSFIPERFGLRQYARNVMDLPAGTLAGMAILSLVAWSVVCLAFQFFLDGMGIVAPWYAAILWVVVVHLGLVIPAAPAALGVYHGLTVVALAVIGIAADAAMAAAIVSHAIVVGVQACLGGVAALRLSLMPPAEKPSAPTA